MAVFIITLISGLLVSTYSGLSSIFITINYASFIVLGILVAAGLNLPPSVLFLLVGLFGFVFGYLNGLELPSAASPVLFSLGVVTGFILFFLWITALTLSLKKHWFQIGLRVVGSWVAAIGLLLLGLYM